MQNPSQKQAFTLVELIVVITILSILGTIAFVSMGGFTRYARDSTRLSDIANIESGLGTYVSMTGQYPRPDNGVDITYGGGKVWTQGTVGKTTIEQLKDISKVPTDPLVGNEYTYSVLNTGLEYQIGTIKEAGLLGRTDILTNQANAAGEKTALAVIRGNYNGKFLKVPIGAIEYVLSVPSIISSDITETTLTGMYVKDIFVYNGYKNLPDSYKGKGYSMVGGFDFTPTNPVAYSGSIDVLASSGTLQTVMIDNLKTAYQGTTLQTDTNMQEFLTSTTQTDKSKLTLNYIGNHIAGLYANSITINGVMIGGGGGGNVCSAGGTIPCNVP